MNLTKSLFVSMSIFCFFAKDSFAGTVKSFIFEGTEITDPQLKAATISVNHHCSGFIIGQNFAITASHCNALEGQPVYFNGTECSVAKTFDAPDAIPNFDIGDLTLIKMTCPPSAMTGVQPFELPRQDERFDGSVQIVGYGSGTGYGDNYPDLYGVPATVVTNYDELEKKIASEEKDDTLGETSNARLGLNLCFNETEGHAMYYGDSGGPTYVKTPTGYKVISVNSEILYDDNSLAARFVFAMCGVNLAHYTNWILKTMKANK